MYANGHDSSPSQAHVSSGVGMLTYCLALFSFALLALCLGSIGLLSQSTSVLVQISLVPGTLGIALLILVSPNISADHSLQPIAIARYASACTAVFCLCIWSTSLVATILLASIVGGCLLVPIGLHRAGLQVMLVPQKPQSESSANDCPSAQAATDSGHRSAELNDDPSEGALKAESDTDGAWPATDLTIEKPVGNAESIEAEIEEADRHLERREQMVQDHSATMQLARWSTDGNDVLTALLRCRFEPNQTTQSIHLPIWPFFQAIPETYVELVDGPASIVGVGEAKPFGLRIDLRLEQATDRPISLLVELSASSPAKQNSVVKPANAA